MSAFLFLSCCIFSWFPCNEEPKPEINNLNTAKPEAVLIPGYYKLHGVTENGSLYEGYVTISTHGENYLVEWNIENQKSKIGTGVLVGRTLAVIYYTEGSAVRDHGVACFQINEDGMLQGAYSKHMHKCRGKELLYFTEPL